ncbi:hypothetical protein QBC39DRAFT_16044 [Podospora conica]|nr:hypothetical protein QBC39DRAFT_16044 [Schizothecium conicum]
MGWSRSPSRFLLCLLLWRPTTSDYSCLSTLSSRSTSTSSSCVKISSAVSQRRQRARGNWQHGDDRMGVPGMPCTCQREAGYSQRRRSPTTNLDGLIGLSNRLVDPEPRTTTGSLRGEAVRLQDAGSPAIAHTPMLHIDLISLLLLPLPHHPIPHFLSIALGQTVRVFGGEGGVVRNPVVGHVPRVCVLGLWESGPSPRLCATSLRRLAPCARNCLAAAGVGLAWFGADTAKARSISPGSMLVGVSVKPGYFAPLIRSPPDRGRGRDGGIFLQETVPCGLVESMVGKPGASGQGSWARID